MDGFTSLEQSKIDPFLGGYFPHVKAYSNNILYDVPAWSFQALHKLIPNNFMVCTDKNDNEFVVTLYDNQGLGVIEKTMDSPTEALFEIIVEFYKKK